MIKLSIVDTMDIKGTAIYMLLTEIHVRKWPTLNSMIAIVHEKGLRESIQSGGILRRLQSGPSDNQFIKSWEHGFFFFFFDRYHGNTCKNRKGPALYILQNNASGKASGLLPKKKSIRVAHSLSKPQVNKYSIISF